jgi:hypothetical protein
MWGIEGIVSRFLNAGTTWKGVISFMLPVPVGQECWVGSGAGLDAVVKRSIYHYRESNPGSPAHSVVTIPVPNVDYSGRTKHGLACMVFWVVTLTQ